MNSTGTTPVVGRAVCHRHPRHVWIASCPDCTSWHLAVLRAGRQARPAVSRPRTDDDVAPQVA
ncbi:hypothetical protein SAMN05660690_4413 [Geodermatophilus telluris]|uniref:Uncharacterized protein n=1 Tax=Geodermatophilus telluris TaxID=1190417 RepID=A0A1G6V9S2_9ACTN|nr:hypothetical protein [Geodermatophilus telluris]SDD50318.1 hypothetical protein SAMN05660690_4413 [Geodermatophilus telluris]